MLLAKTCSSCGDIKPRSAFNPHPTTRDGLDSRCAECRRAQSREHYAKNKERYAETRRAWYETHKDEHNARTKRTRQGNPKRYAEYMRAWRAANPEKAKAASAKRRARLRQQTADDVNYERILKRDGFRCYLCLQDVAPEDVHFDHVVPIARGGPHSEDNIRVTHGRCNREKGSQLLPEHLAGDLSAYERFNDPLLIERVRATHCPQGHPYEGDNLVINSRGYRLCRTCRNDRARERQRLKKGYYDRPRRERSTHCPHGHEFTAENTYTYLRNGSEYRYCRECNREAARQQHAKKKLAAT